MAQEWTIDALQQLGLTRGGPAAAPGDDIIDARAEQDEALVSSVLQVILLIILLCQNVKALQELL